MPEIFMPRLSDTMEEGAITRWIKKVGDHVKKGDVIAEIETDKALMELEAYDSGVLTEILVEEGATVPIGAPIARVGTEGEAVTTAPAAPAAAAASPAPEPVAAPASAPAPAPAEAPAIEIFMPRLSDTMEEGAISRWIKKVGDHVEKGDVIAEIETDKALMELEAYESGVLTQILVDEGATVPIGAPIATLGGSDVTRGPAVVAHVPDSAVPGAPRTAEPSGAVAPAARIPGAERADGGRVKASPMARAVARDLGIDLRSVTGTGPGGRIVRADVEAAGRVASAAPAAPAAPAALAPPVAAPTVQPAVTPDVEEVPLSNIRKVTARRLTESMQSTPHFYLTAVIDADALLAFRADLNARLANAEVGVKVSVNDLVVKACAAALRANPVLNVSFGGDKILQHRRVNVGFAVAVDAGLIVPVIKDADQKSLSQIATEAKALIAKAREGKLKLDEFTGGTFTVSNLGMYGVSHFTAVINPPEAAILAVGGTSPEPAVRDGEVVVRNTMRMTLSIDHRAVDGATGAKFLQQLKAILEEPLLIVA
jgi:pyruvate dehydrogenase E2 component (dihydrolipoamide acetyltransferase)